MDPNQPPQIIRNPFHDIIDEFIEKTDIQSLHNSLYTTYFDYLKSAPQTDTFSFKKASNDIYILLEFLKNLEKISQKNKPND